MANESFKKHVIVLLYIITGCAVLVAMTALAVGTVMTVGVFSYHSTLTDIADTISESKAITHQLSTVINPAARMLTEPYSVTLARGIDPGQQSILEQMVLMFSDIKKDLVLGTKTLEMASKELNLLLKLQGAIFTAVPLVESPVADPDQ